MSHTFSRSQLLAFLSAATLVAGFSVTALAQDNGRPSGPPSGRGPRPGAPRPEGDKPPTIPPVTTARAAETGTPAPTSYGSTNLAYELKEVQDKVKDGKRMDLVDMVDDLKKEIETKQKSPAGEDTVQQFTAQRKLLDTVMRDSTETLNRVQTAMLASARNGEVRELVEGKRTEPAVTTQKVPGALFDLRVTYEREGEGDQATLKRKVEFVAKEDNELKKSENPAIQAIAKDARFEPVRKDAVDAAVAQVQESVEDFISEPAMTEQKISAIDAGKGPNVETGIAAPANKEALTASLEKADAQVAEGVQKATAKRDIAADDAQAELQKLEGKKQFAEWAIKNPEEAKKLDECGMAAKVMSLNNKLTFDMLDESTRDKCKDLAKQENEKSERKLLALGDGDASKPAAGGAPNFADEQVRNKTMQNIMQVVQACMQANYSASDSIQRIKDQIKPAYEAIAGFDRLKKSLDSSTIALNILGKMDDEGIDGVDAANDIMRSVAARFPDKGTGPSEELLAEFDKLMRANGMLAKFVNEYNRRSEEMARAVGDMEAKNFLALSQRALQGDVNAQNDMNARAQQGLPMNAKDVYKVAYDGQMMERRNATDHVQQLSYKEAIGAAFTRVASLVNEQHESKAERQNTWVGSSVASSARSVLSNSPTLRSNPNVSVDAALSRSPATVVAAPTTGNLRATGAPAPTTQVIIQQGAQGVRQSTSPVMR